MNKQFLKIAALMFAAMFLQTPVYADKDTANNQTVSEKADEVASDTGKSMKKAGRTVKDKTCHMVKGKMECAGEKVKHKAQNAGDEVKDKVEDVKK